MPRAVVLLALALLAAGCTSAPSVQDEDARAWLVMLDGRWDFDASHAAPAVADALRIPAFDVGLAWIGEGRLFAEDAARAGLVVALDDRARELLGEDDAPLPGALLARDLPAGPARVEADGWPTHRVTSAFEMDRVRPCDEGGRAPLCSRQTTPDGEAELVLEVPEATLDLRFHADVVELGPADYPAHWNGVFVSPSGERTTWQTSAISRGETRPPGLVAGPVEPGTWRILFTLDLNGTRAPGAVAGFVTMQTPGFGPFETDLLRLGDAAAQTRAVLANGTTRALESARIAGAPTPGGALDAVRALALAHPDDARALFGVRAGNVTALVVHATASQVRAMEASLGEAPDVLLPLLRARPAQAAAAQAVDPLVLAAPAGLDVAELPPVEGARVVTMSFEPRLPPGTNATLRDREVFPRVLAVPVGAGTWSLQPGGHWADESTARSGIATSPHLVIASFDLAARTGHDGASVRYAPLLVDSAVGPRSVFTMAATADGPKNVMWVSAALAASLGAPAGGRIVLAPDDGVAPETLHDRALASWSARGVAALD